MAKAPAYQMYALDFDMDTASWDNEEVGIYLRLLNYQWINGAVPCEMEDLARIVRMTPKKFEKKWRKNLHKKFSAGNENGLKNSRLESERQKQLNYREEQSKNGNKGAEKRWQNHGVAHSDPIGNPNGENIALQSSVFNTSKPKDFTSPKPATASPKKPLSKSSNLTHRLVGRFSEAYEKATGQVYAMVPGRDGKLMKELAAAMANGGGREESDIEAHVVAAILRFFDSGHKFKGNMDVPQFRRAFNRLQADAKPRDGPDPDDPLWVRGNQPEATHDA